MRHHPGRIHHGTELNPKKGIGWGGEDLAPVVHGEKGADRVY